MSEYDNADIELAELCKALGHPARVKIVRHMLSVNACYFGGLTEVLDLAPSTISQHVSSLRKAGILTEGQKECRSCHCIEPSKLERIRTLIGKL